ncbi:hypothetical protein BH11MYX2_BH11MYX2_01660 [soil metagenome]
MACGEWSCWGGYKHPCKRSDAPLVIDTVIAAVGASVCIAGVIATIGGDTGGEGAYPAMIVCSPGIALANPAILSAQRGYSGAQTCE